MTMCSPRQSAAARSRRPQSPWRAGTSAPLCRGPIALAVEGRNLLANCLLDHALVVRELTANGELGKELARITHSGPFWGFSARERGGALFIAASGVASQLVTRIGFKPVLAAGMTSIAVALAWFSQVSVGGGFTTDILGPSLLAAIGLGFAFVTTQLVNHVPGATAPMKLAYASALVAAFVYAGGLIASAFLPEPKSEHLPE